VPGSHNPASLAGDTAETEGTYGSNWKALPAFLYLINMKQITLNIPDSKYQDFMELITRLGIEESHELAIPEAHKTIVRDRIKNTKPEEYLTWEEVREQLKLD